MIDRYNRDVTKLKIELSSYSTLKLDDLKFIISNIAQLGINNIDLDLKNAIDYNYLIDVIDFIRYECNIDEISVISECIGIQPYLKSLKKSGLKNIIICIDSLKQYKYKSIHSGSNINDIIKTIDNCLDLDFKITIKCILINEFNTDEINDYISMTKLNPIDVCFSEIIPVSGKLKDFENSYIDINKLLSSNSNVFSIGTINKYKLFNSVGNIYVESHNYSENCSTCNKIIMTDSAFIKTCVHKNSGFDIKPYIYKPMLFKETVKEIICLKPKNNIESGAYYG